MRRVRLGLGGVASGVLTLAVGMFEVVTAAGAASAPDPERATVYFTVPLDNLHPGADDCRSAGIRRGHRPARPPPGRSRFCARRSGVGSRSRQDTRTSLGPDRSGKEGGIVVRPSARHRWCRHQPRRGVPFERVRPLARAPAAAHSGRRHRGCGGRPTARAGLPLGSLWAVILESPDRWGPPRASELCGRSHRLLPGGREGPGAPAYDRCGQRRGGDRHCRGGPGVGAKPSRGEREPDRLGRRPGRAYERAPWHRGRRGIIAESIR